MKVVGVKDYPGGTRLYLRADPLDPELTALLFDAEGHRVAAFLPNAPEILRRVP